MFRALLLVSVLLALCELSFAQNYEFCYILQGGASSTTGGYAVTAHGYFYTSGTSTPLTITNTAITRNVITALGQRHTEQLAGIVPTNNRVDQLLYLTYPSGSGYVDGSGIQLPINGSTDNTNGQGTLLGYNVQSQPAVFVSNAAYGLTSQLNDNINLLWGGSNYGERLDAGGATITVSTSNFFIQPYSATTAITNCSVTVSQPLCVNYPQTPPAGSVLFNITLNTAWANLPATYIADLLTALTVSLAPSNTQAQYLGLWLFSCFPVLSKITLAQPQLWFYLNAQSASAMGLSLSTIVPQIYATLQPGATAINNAYLPPGEQGLIAAIACPTVYNGGMYPGINGCGSTVAPTSAPSPSSSAAVASPFTSSSSSSAAAITPVGPANNNSGGGSSGLSHGAIAGIVIGSVAGVTLLLFILFFLMRCVSSSGGKSTGTDGAPGADANHKRFENEASQVSKSTAADSTNDGSEGVEMA